MKKKEDKPLEGDLPGTEKPHEGVPAPNRAAPIPVPTSVRAIRLSVMISNESVKAQNVLSRLIETH